MNNLLRIRTLTDKFFDGDTTPKEEQELYDFYRQDDIPEDLRSNRELFRDLAALGSLTPSVHYPPSTIHHPLSTYRHRWWIATAAVVLVLLIGGATLYHHQRTDECVAYIYGERVTDRDVVLSEMQKTMTAMTADGSDVVEEQLKAMFGD
jgi:hypothetical protein